MLCRIVSFLGGGDVWRTGTDGVFAVGGLGEELKNFRMKTPSEGAATSIRAALDPTLEGMF